LPRVLTGVDWHRVDVVLLDIEGTTTPISFVHDGLFPYARQHADAYLRRVCAATENTAAPEVPTAETLAEVMLLWQEYAVDLRGGASPPRWRDVRGDMSGAVAYVHWLMGHDRKSTALKAIQGRIWQEGYRSGELKGEVYDDVPRALRRWRGQGRRICIYSSGSVLAQQLLFSCSSAGDLSEMLAGYFDTTIGPKRQATSYRAIAEHLDLRPSAVLFVSDVVLELDAAHAAGMSVVLCIRQGSIGPSGGSPYPTITSFDELTL
jgi:enolase-phosphatase E1